ncbi:MAG TPA: type IV-A pilus assembly ATPase PilB, partial [Gammaproteobacteria bacterium]|nr:type IV-A pilus assembly ATPase PilB [Gammaproteobacteria bacterium]
MATTTDIPLDGLARKLVQDNLLSHEEAQDALQGAKSDKLPFVTYLTKNDILSARQVATMASLEFGLPLFDISRLESNTETRNLVKEKLVRKHHLLPIFKRGNRLFVGISDPTNLEALDEIKFASGLNIEAIIVEDDKLVLAIEKAFAQEDLDIGEGLDDEDLDALDIVSGEEEMDTTDDEAGGDDAPIVRFVNKVLLDGIHKGVSDLHFEPYEKSFRIRFRQDG